MQFWEKLYRSFIFQQPLSIPPFLRGLMSLGGLVIASSSLAQQIADNQCDNVPGILSGNIKVTNSVGCAPLRVEVSNAQINSVKNQYIYDYKGGNPGSYKTTVDSAFSYTKPGLYLLMKLSETPDGKPQRVCATITVQDSTPPTFRVLACSNGNVNLTITNHAVTQYEEYVVEWGDGNAAIMNNMNLTAQYQYTDSSPKKITVQGRHRISHCGGKSSRNISLETNTKPAILSKLEIMDATTGELTVSNPNQLELELYRNEGAGVFRTLGTIIKSAEEKVKVLVDSNRIFCYKVKPRDSCAASLESNVLCTGFIKITTEMEANVVNVTPYLRPSDLKGMSVKRNDAAWWTPTVTQWSKPDTEGQCGKETCYQLEITTQDGLMISNKVCAQPPPSSCNPLGSLFVPDAFSPNGDGVNDLFELKGDIGGEAQILIYDRWGTVIFSNNVNVRHWNGAVNGNPAPSGPYIYRINVTDKLGRTFVKRGTVSLLR